MLMLIHVEKCFAKQGQPLAKAPIAWTAAASGDGSCSSSCFVIRDSAKLVSDWLPQFFRPVAKFSSFTRKLYRWGFHQPETTTTNVPPANNAPAKGSVGGGGSGNKELVFENEYFQRHNTALLSRMKSVTAASTRREQNAAALAAAAAATSRGDQEHQMLLDMAAPLSRVATAATGKPSVVVAPAAGFAAGISSNPLLAAFVPRHQQSMIPPIAGSQSFGGSGGADDHRIDLLLSELLAAGGGGGGSGRHIFQQQQQQPNYYNSITAEQALHRIRLQQLLQGAASGGSSTTTPAMHGSLLPLLQLSYHQATTTANDTMRQRMLASQLLGIPPSTLSLQMLGQQQQPLQTSSSASRSSPSSSLSSLLLHGAGTFPSSSTLLATGTPQPSQLRNSNPSISTMNLETSADAGDMDDRLRHAVDMLLRTTRAGGAAGEQLQALNQLRLGSSISSRRDDARDPNHSYSSRNLKPPPPPPPPAL
jgi:HSF-type DNA-binding